MIKSVPREGSRRPLRAAPRISVQRSFLGAGPEFEAEVCRRAIGAGGLE
jgi:hypothetical protein